MGNDKRLKSEVGMDFEDFTDYIYSLLQASWGEDWGVFTIEHPTHTDTTNKQFPQIVYELTSAEPGMYGRNKELKPRLRENIIETNEVNNEKSSYSIYAQTIDMEITFYIYADNNKRASIITRKFKEFLYESTGFLKQKGLVQIFFKNESYASDRSNETYAVRKLVYYIRTEETYRIDDVILQEVGIQADAIYNEALANNSLPSQTNI